MDRRYARSMSRARVVIAGAGLAGLTAAHYLERAGAEVTVVEARDRVGGRVHTIRGFEGGQHAEAGADLIESEQADLLGLAAEFGLATTRILRKGWGFYGSTNSGRNRIRSAPDTFERAAERLEPEIAAFKRSGRRWDSAVGQLLARQSAAGWLKASRADTDLSAGLRGLRGFFLADPEQLSLLQLVDQFASEDMPGEGRMYRLRDGNDALPAALAASLRGRILLSTVVKRIGRRNARLRVAVDDGRLRQLPADYVVMAVPASTLKAVVFRPSLPEDQWRAITNLRYGPATRVILQFDRRFWKRPGRPTAYGTDQSTGAVWDGNEEQSGKPGILSLLAGGNAAREVRALIRRQGWPGLMRRLSWLGRPARLLAATTIAWDRDPWVRGGYAVFDPHFDPRLRPWLSRPADRIVFAGEHTSDRWQGYMNGAVESGRRAAIEVAMTAGLSYERIV
jgi:monoamine oxidase